MCPRQQFVAAVNDGRVHHQDVAECFLEDDAEDLRRAGWALQTNLVSQQPLAGAAKVGGQGAG